MGWKNVKEHYQIKHIVQTSGDMIFIGSSYVHNLITIGKDGGLMWGTMGPSHNDDLARYYEEMSADKNKLLELIAKPDSFDKSITVYTYDGGDIIEKQCEELGWPNCTHDGLMMYDNTFSASKKKIIEWAKSNNKTAVEVLTERIADTLKELEDIKVLLLEHQNNLKQLEEV